MTTIDARGQDCPRPVMMAREATERGVSELTVLVDNAVAASNVTRFLDRAGYSVARFEEGDDFRLVAQIARSTQAHTGAVFEIDADPPSDADYAFLISSRHIGAASDGLGEILMKSWLGTIKTHNPLPSVIALMNDGVKLALPGPEADTLRELEERGVELLVCGTCTKHFGITDEIAVGKISNMFEITEAVYGTSKPITIG
ncbi:sulfurtransferase-like selenium metabolism protein YedF [Synergistaceae bacterium OttesenSCG-928-I11]|nr:sulfurtransferase-like selenium metabolism protein YedF [Synergistaceae bacterium OttesenSCG-928-I11]